MSAGKVDWRRLLDLQSKLDEYIFGVKGLDYFSTGEERKLALAVELSELVNETKAFKFWSVKEMDRSRALDEYADVLHFILSHFLAQKIDPTPIEYPKSVEIKGRNEITNECMRVISSLFSNWEGERFRNWVSEFFRLGSWLGFSLEDIISAYEEKYRINIERQKEGY